MPDELTEVVEAVDTEVMLGVLANAATFVLSNIDGDEERGCDVGRLPNGGNIGFGIGSIPVELLKAPK